MILVELALRFIGWFSELYSFLLQYEALPTTYLTLTRQTRTQELIMSMYWDTKHLFYWTWWVASGLFLFRDFSFIVDVDKAYLNNHLDTCAACRGITIISWPRSRWTPIFMTKRHALVDFMFMVFSFFFFFFLPRFLIYSQTIHIFS